MNIKTEAEYTAFLDEAFLLLQVVNRNDNEEARLNELVKAIDQWEDIVFAVPQY
jgi:hypothetical protein